MVKYLVGDTTTVWVQPRSQTSCRVRDSCFLDSNVVSVIELCLRSGFSIEETSKFSGVSGYVVTIIYYRCVIEDLFLQPSIKQILISPLYSTKVQIFNSWINEKAKKYSENYDHTLSRFDSKIDALSGRTWNSRHNSVISQLRLIVKLLKLGLTSVHISNLESILRPAIKGKRIIYNPEKCVAADCYLVEHFPTMDKLTRAIILGKIRLGLTMERRLLLRQLS